MICYVRLFCLPVYYDVAWHFFCSIISSSQPVAGMTHQRTESRIVAWSMNAWAFGTPIIMMLLYSNHAAAAAAAAGNNDDDDDKDNTNNTWIRMQWHNKRNTNVKILLSITYLVAQWLYINWPKMTFIGYEMFVAQCSILKLFSSEISYSNMFMYSHTRVFICTPNNNNIRIVYWYLCTWIYELMR